MVKIFLNNMSAWDSSVCLKIFRMNGRRLIDPVMYWSSRLGDGYIYPFIGILIFIINSNIGVKFLFSGLIAFTIETTVQFIIKNLFKRKRPYVLIPEIDFLVKPPDKFSFPSGHTAAAFLMAFLASHFFPVVTFPAYLLASVIGFSRIYNGLYYPSDVIAGMLLGLISAQIGIFIMV